MNLQTLLSSFDWLSILTYSTTAISGGLAGGLLLLGIQTYFKKGIAHQFNKKMQELKENHDKTLAAIGHEYNKQLSLFNAAIAKEVDKETRDFQRKIHDFSLYSTKKHEIYPNLFKQIHSLKNGLSMVEHYSYSSAHGNNVSQISKHLEFFGFTLSENSTKSLDKIFQTIRDNESKRIEKLMNIIRMDILSQLSRKYHSVDVFFEGNMIYMSDKVSENVLDFLRLLSLSLSNQMIIPPGEGGNYPFKVTNEEMDEGIKEIKDLLKSELSIGYYEG
ncbi:hypothetical protein ABEP18_21330 [Priestia megaterium]